MSSSDLPAPFVSCRARIRELLAAGVDMSEVERTIEAESLDRDEQDALWLWAIGQRGLCASRTYDPINGRGSTHPRRPSNDNVLKGTGHD